MTEKILRTLFDFQRFAGNKDLEEVISETESHYGRALSDDELSYVSAAGVPSMMNIRESDKDKNSYHPF